MGSGLFQVALENIENCVAKYGYKPEHVDPQHKGRFTKKDYAMLLPLLERQSYIEKVGSWRQGDTIPDVDLDEFRSVLYRSFEGNILQAYHHTFGIPFYMEDYDATWIEADTIKTKPIVVSRSSRYIPPNGDDAWKNFAETIDFSESAIFVGTPKEHVDFVKLTGAAIEYRPVENFLELASIINGADLVMCNQGFTYSLAIGLGKQIILEINKLVPMQQNECFFPRPSVQYV